MLEVVSVMGRKRRLGSGIWAGITIMTGWSGKASLRRKHDHSVNMTSSGGGEKWSADVGWGELFKAEGMPTQAPEMGMCLVCSRGSKKAWKGGLEESRTVKPL